MEAEYVASKAVPLFHIIDIRQVASIWYRLRYCSLKYDGKRRLSKFATTGSKFFLFRVDAF